MLGELRLAKVMEGQVMHCDLRYRFAMQCELWRRNVRQMQAMQGNVLRCNVMSCAVM